MVKTYSDGMIERWSKEIDTYLVFAGLFSAILTAFNVQSYPLLQPDAPDPAIAVLQQISSQLASFSITPPFVNSTQPANSNGADVDADTPPRVPRWILCLNALWFSALILSLTSASLGIMVKQWLNEYSSGLSGVSRPVARVRQYRLTNLKRWHMEDIVGMIPLLLQLALAFFLVGLLVLLWNLHYAIAAIVSALVVVLAVFTIVTTFLPLFDHSCPYLTPQIRALHLTWQPKRVVYRVCAALSSVCRAAAALLGGITSRLVSQDSLLPRWGSQRLASVFRGISLLLIRPYSAMFRYLERTLPQPQTWNGPKQTWQGQEQSAIRPFEIKTDLDIRTLVEAYSCTLHPDALDAATVCLMDLSPRDALEYFRKLVGSIQEHFGPMVAEYRDGHLVKSNLHQPLWIHILLCTFVSREDVLSEDETRALGVYTRGGLWPSSMQAAEIEWAAYTLCSIIDHLDGEKAQTLPFLPDGHVHYARSTLISKAVAQKVPLGYMLFRAITGAYRRIRNCHAHLADGFSDHVTLKTAHVNYMETLKWFLETVHDIVTLEPLQVPEEDMKTVRTYTHDVLAEFTWTILSLLGGDMRQHIHAIIVARNLRDIIDRLKMLGDDFLNGCIPDDLVLELLGMLDMLMGFSDYRDDHWVIDQIRIDAYQLKETVCRIKGLFPEVHLMNPRSPG
ncbi:hypothetical protein VTO73DRAFT_9002 [Trametes versicolor]